VFTARYVHTFYVLPTQFIYVFCVGLRTDSDYFTVQHYMTGLYNLTGLYNRDGVCLLCGTFCPVYLCVLCGSQNKKRLFNCIALTEMGCVYCAVGLVFKYVSD